MKIKKAFTLIELLVVIAIIGLLAIISVVVLNNARAKARDTKRVANVKQVQTALELFFNDTGRYPTTAEWNTGQLFSTTSGATSTYMQVIPVAPSPADGACAAGENTFVYNPNVDGSSYFLSFCLGGRAGNLTASTKCATPSGIKDGACYIMATNFFGDYRNSKYTGFWAVTFDTNYVYAAGYTGETTPTSTVLVKYSKGDMGVLTAKTLTLSGGEASIITTLISDEDYVYAIGSYAQSNSDKGILLAKYRKSDLSLISQKLYSNGTHEPLIANAKLSGSSIYAVGSAGTDSNGFDALVLKINTDNLTLSIKEVLQTSDDDVLNAIDIAGNYLYAVGRTGDSNATAIIAKLNISDLSIAAQKTYNGSAEDVYTGIYVTSTFAYVVGYSTSEGDAPTSSPALIMKYNIGDLSLASGGKKLLYNSGAFFMPLVWFGDAVYEKDSVFYLTAIMGADVRSAMPSLPLLPLGMLIFKMDSDLNINTSTANIAMLMQVPDSGGPSPYINNKTVFDGTFLYTAGSIVNMVNNQSPENASGVLLKNNIVDAFNIPGALVSSDIPGFDIAYAPAPFLLNLLGLENSLGNSNLSVSDGSLSVAATDLSAISTTLDDDDSITTSTTKYFFDAGN